MQYIEASEMITTTLHIYMAILILYLGGSECIGIMRDVRYNVYIT